MLTKTKAELLKELLVGSTREELIWISGYLNGILNQQSELPVQEKQAVNKITIAYGTETGNAKKLATDFASKARKKGLQPKLVSLEQYRLSDFAKEEYFFTVISTQGDGEPPAGARKFYDHIYNNGSIVNGLKYAVLALGDTSYPLFCKAGEDVDEQLNKLGGKRFLPLQKCDTDYEQEADIWFNQIIENLSKEEKDPAISVITTQPSKTSGKKIYEGTVLTNINLNDKGSEKQTHHLEIMADELEYTPGDALGIIPENPMSVIESILAILNIRAEKEFTYRNTQIRSAEILKKKVNIVFLSERVLHKYSLLTKQDIPLTKIGLLDLLRIYPLKASNNFSELLDILEPITPRLYSIASSPVAHTGEIHLTVAKDTFCINGEVKYGLCSDYFSLLQPGEKFNFYIYKNNQFQLPENDRDIIMIGPGTGVAPFRSFIAHREATGATGRNWLFFGDQHFVTDFLYQSEWLNWIETGVLTKLNVAFSRDQREKIYVQHKMKKHASELFNWIDNGAVFYVCGAKEPMGIDVEGALIEIIREKGNYTPEKAQEYLDKMKEDGKYLKDVY